MNVSKGFILGILVSLIVILGIKPAFSQQPEKTFIRITPLQKDDLEQLNDLDLDYAYRGLKDYVELFATQEQLDIISARGFTIEVLQQLSKANLWDEEYHTFEEMVDELDSLHQEYPAITAIHQIGVSQRYQYPIWAIKRYHNRNPYKAGRNRVLQAILNRKARSKK